jgi:hypothetical protein
LRCVPRDKPKVNRPGATFKDFLFVMFGTPSPIEMGVYFSFNRNNLGLKERDDAFFPFIP